MRIHVTLRQLEIFVAIARHGQVTRAAEELYLTQSATSMALAQLEKLLDVVLFHREGRQLVLTEQGRLLLAEAPGLLEQVHELPALLGGRGGKLRGELRVAASTTVARYLIAPHLAAFGERHPALKLSLAIANAESAAAALSGHRADLAYVEGPVADPNLRAERWKEDRMEIVTSAACWKRRPRELTREQIPELEWIMREPGSGTREILERALQGAGLPPPTQRLRLEDSEAILQTVAAGIGIACLSRLVVAQALRTKQVIALQAPFLALGRTLWRLTRVGGRAGPAQRAFSEFVH
jgi:DNA-binding transcriptional LysR family regulator